MSLAVSNGDTFNFYLAINFALCCKEGQEHIGKGFNFNIEKNDSQKEQITEKLKSKHFFFVQPPSRNYLCTVDSWKLRHSI